MASTLAAALSLPPPTLIFSPLRAPQGNPVNKEYFWDQIPDLQFNIIGKE